MYLKFLEKTKAKKEEEGRHQKLQRFISVTLPAHCSEFYECSRSIVLYLCLEFQTP